MREQGIEPWTIAYFNERLVSQSMEGNYVTITPLTPIDVLLQS